MSKTVIVVPCYNEARRLALSEYKRLLNASEPATALLFVNDCSTDRTGEVLRAFAREQGSARVQVLDLPQNGGKGEAVRQGLLAAIEQEAALIGYIDADLAAPVPEVLRVLDALKKSSFQAAFGSRIQLLGFHVERSAKRHYLGRIFATMASLILRLSVYDTQCGAKFFRVNPWLHQALGRPFLSRWAFDVELIGRLVRQPSWPQNAFVEVPLHRWSDVEGSKLNGRGMIQAGVDLIRIYFALRKPPVALSDAALAKELPSKN